MAEEAEDGLDTELVEELAPEEVEDTPEVAKEEPEAPPPADPVEDLAREMGWAPKDQWRGDPDQWKDARTFVRSTADINRSISKEVRELRETTQRLAKTSGAIAEREIARGRAELEARFAEAVEAGDVQAANQARREIDQFERTAPIEPQEHPAVSEFKSRNDWYGKHKGASAIAFAECDRLAQAGVFDPEAQLVAAEAEVRRRFPELFEEPKAKDPPKRQPVVHNANTRAAPGPKPKTASALPPAARAAAEDFLRRGRIKNLDEYAKIYFEEEEG